MPKVPEEQSPTFNTYNVPGVNLPYRMEFGKVGQAAERLGESTEVAGGAATDIYNEVQRQQAISQSQNASTARTTDLESYWRDLKTASPDGFVHQNGDQSQPISQDDNGNPRTIVQEFHDYANKKYMEDQDNLSPIGKAMYRNSMLKEISSRLVDANNEAHSMMVKDSEQKRNDNNEINYKEFNIAPWNTTYGPRQMPDITKFSDYLQKAELGLHQQGGVLDPNTGELKGGLFNQEQINAIKTKQRNEYGERWFESAISNIRDEKKEDGPTMSRDLHNLLDIVDGKDPQSRAFESAGKLTPHSALTAEAQLKIRNQLISLIPTAKSTDMSEFNLYEKNYMAGAEMGKYPSDKPNASRMNLMNWGNTFLKNGDWSEADYIQHVTNWTAAEIKGEFGGRNFETMPTDQQRAFVNERIQNATKAIQQNAQMYGLKWTSDLGDQINKEVRDQSEAKILELDGKKKADLPGFLSQPDNRGAPRSGALYMASKLDWSNPAGLEKSGLIPKMLNQLGNSYYANFKNNMSYWRPISKEQSATLGASLAGQSPTQQAQSIESLKRSFGKAYPNLMDTLIQDDSLKGQSTASADWKFIGAVQGTQARVAQLSAMQNITATKELYEGQTGKKWDDLQAAVDKHYKDDIANIIKTSPLNVDQRTYAASVRKRVTAAAAQMILQTQNNNIDDVLTNSKREIFKDMPTIEQVGNKASILGFKTPFSSGPQVKVARPANISDDQWSVVTQNLNSLMTEDGLKKAGVAAPVPAKGQPDFSSHFHKMAADNITSINLVNSAHDGPGYTIDYQGINPDTGRPNGQINHLMDDKGNIKFFPLDQLKIPRGPKPAPAQIPRYIPEGMGLK